MNDLKALDPEGNLEEGRRDYGRERRTHIRKPRNKNRKTETKTSAHTRTIQNNYKNVEDPSLKRTPYVHSRFSKGQKRQHRNHRRHHKEHVERKDQVFDDHKYHLVIPHNYTISGNAYAMDLSKGDNGFDNLMTPTINTFTTGADLSLGNEIEEALHPHVSRYVSPEPSFENEHLHHNDEGYLHHTQHNEEKFSRENDEDSEHNSERLHHHVEGYPHHMHNEEENFSHQHEDHNGEHLHHHVEGYPHHKHNDEEENFSRHNEERENHDNEHSHHHEESYPHHEEESKYHDKERVHHDEGNHYHNDGDKSKAHPATRRQCCPIGFEPHCCPHINTHLIEHYDIKETTLKHMQPNGCCMSGFQSSCCPIEVVEMPHGLMKSEPQGGCCMKEMENQCCAFESAPEQNYNFPLHPINITETPPNIEDTQKDMYPPPSSSGELINHGSLSGESTIIQEHEPSSSRDTHPPIHELESGFPDAGKPPHNMKEGSYHDENARDSEKHHHDGPYKEGPHESPMEETHHSFSKEHHDENEGSKEFKQAHETNEKNFNDFEHSDKSHSSNFEEHQKSHPVEEMKHHEDSHVTPFSKDDEESHLDSSHGLANEKDHGTHTEGFHGPSSEESHSGSKESYPEESHSGSKEPHPEESHSDSKGPHFEEFYNDSKGKHPEESHESHSEDSKSHSKDFSMSKSEKSQEDSSKESDESHLDNHESSKLESDNHQEPCHEDEGAKCSKETSSHSDDSPHEPSSSLHSEEPIGKPSGEPSAFNAEGSSDKLPGESHPDGDHKSHMEDLHEPCHEESHEPCAKDSKMSYHDEPNHENPSEGEPSRFEGSTKGTHSSSSDSHPDESHASGSPDPHESPPGESHAAHSEKFEDSHESHSEDSSARHPEESNESHPMESHTSHSEDSHEPHPDDSFESHSKESHDSNPMESHATHSEGSHESHFEGPTHSEGSLKPQSEKSHATNSEDSHESHPDGEHAAHTESSNESHLTETKTATSKASQESPRDESHEAHSEDSEKSSSEEFLAALTEKSNESHLTDTKTATSKDSQESPHEESHEAHSNDSLESHSEKSKESQESLEEKLHALQSGNPTDSSPKEPEKENPEGSQANHNDSKNENSEKPFNEEPKHSPADGPSDVKEFSTDSQTTPVSIKEAENTTDEHAQCRANDEHCERSYPITPKVSFDLEGSFAATSVHPVDSGIHDIKSGDHGMGPERGGSAAHHETVEEHECTNPIPAGPCKSLEEPPIHEENPGYPLYHIPKSKDCAPVEVVNRPCPPAFGCNPYEVLTSSALNGTAFLTDQFPCAPPHEHHVEDEHLVPATSFQPPHNEEMPHHNELHPPMIAPNHPPLEPPHSDAPMHHDEHHMEEKCPHHEKCADSAVHPLAESTLTIHEDFKCHSGNDCHESEPAHTSSNYHEIQPPIDHKCHMGEGCNEFESSRPMHYDDHYAGNNVPMTLPIPSTSLHHVNTPLTWMADTVQNPSLHKPTTIVPITYSARSPPPSAPKLKYLVTLKNLHSKNSVPIEPEKRPLKITLNDDMKSDLRYDVSLKNAHTKDLVPHKKSLKKLKAKEAKSVKRKLIDKKKRPTISRREIGAADEMKTTKDLGISRTTSNRFRRSVTTTPRRELKHVRNKKGTKKGKLALLRSSVLKKRNGNTILPPEIAKIKVNSSKESEKNHSTAIAPEPVEPGYTGVGPLKGGGKSYESLTSSGPTQSSEKTNQVTDTSSTNIKQVTKPPEEKGKEDMSEEGKGEEVSPTLPPSRLNNEKEEEKEKEAGGYTGQGPDRGGYSANAQPTPSETTPLTNPAKDETSPVVDDKINEYVGYGPNRGGYTPVTDPPLLADFSKPEEPTKSQLKINKNTEASIEGKGTEESIEGKGGEEGPKTESKGDPKVEGKLEAKVDSNQWISMDAKPTAKEQEIRPIEAKSVSNFLNFSPLDTNEQKPKETEDGATLNSLVEVIENITDEQTQEIKSELHSPTSDEDNSKEEEDNKVHEQRQMAIGAPIHSSPVHLTTGTAQHIAITSPPVRYNQPHAMLMPHNNEGLSSEMKWHDLNNAKINNAVSAQEVQNGKLAQQLSSQEAKNEHLSSLSVMHDEDNKKLLGCVQAHLGENKHLAGKLKENQMENQKLNEELKAQKERNERLANALHVAKIQNHEQMVKIKETARPPPEIKQEKNTAGLTGGGSLTSEPNLNNIVILSGSSSKLQGGAAVSTPQTLYSLLPPPSIKQPAIEGKVERQLNDTPVKPALPPDHGTNPYEVLTSTELAGSPFDKAKSEVIPKLLSSSRDAIISDVQRMMNDTAEQQEEMMYKTPKIKKRERPLNVLEKRNKQKEKIIKKRKKKKKG